MILTELSHLIIEVYFIKKKHCSYLKPQDLTCFFSLQRQSSIIPLPPCFLGHSMHAGPCV